MIRPVRCIARGLGWPLLVAAFVATSSAGELPPNPDTQAEPGFASFLGAFRRALAQDDREALASLTALPFQYEGAELDATAFGRVVPLLFTPEVRGCLAAAEPILEDDRYVIFCTPYAFYFGRVAGEFRLLEFMADGEALVD